MKNINFLYDFFSARVFFDDIVRIYDEQRIIEHITSLTRKRCAKHSIW